MVQGKNSQGVPTTGLENIEGLAAVIKSLEDLGTKGKKGSERLNELNSRMEKLSKAAKLSKDPVVVLGKSFVMLKKTGGDAGYAIEALAKQIEESTGVMTGASKASLEDTIKNIKEMQKELVDSGKGNTREAVLLNSKRAKLEMDSFREQRNYMIGRAKMLQGGSEGFLNRFKGAGMGIANAAIKHGAEAAEFLGGALGLTSSSMMVLAATAGVVIGLLFVANAAAKAWAKGMTDMFEAGDTMNASNQAANKYFHEVSDAASEAGLTMEKMQSVMVAMNKEYGRSLGFGASFAGNVANVGRTFGMANEESVKLATKMAVLARTSDQSKATKAFVYLGMEAAKLRLPIEALADPMTDLADLAGRTGHGLDSAANSMANMLQAVSSLKDMGIAAFQNMKPADIAKMTKEFSGFISGMDEWQLAAMTFKDNESFQGMTERVAGMEGKDRMNAIKQMMDEYGLAGRENSSKLGMLLGAKTPSEALRLGNVAQQATGRGMNDSQYNALMASSIQEQLDSRKTVGERIAIAEDPTAFIMDRVQKILNSLLHIEALADNIKHPFGGGAKVETFGDMAKRVGKTSPSQTAMRAQVERQRSTLQVPM
jgi:hypothetical protein